MAHPLLASVAFPRAWSLVFLSRQKVLPDFLVLLWQLKAKERWTGGIAALSPWHKRKPVLQGEEGNFVLLPRVINGQRCSLWCCALWGLGAQMCGLQVSASLFCLVWSHCYWLMFAPASAGSMAGGLGFPDRIIYKTEFEELSSHFRRLCRNLLAAEIFFIPKSLILSKKKRSVSENHKKLISIVHASFISHHSNSVRDEEDGREGGKGDHF